MLAAYGAGDRSALDGLLPMVYNELRRIAAIYLARERRDHTLQPTALVHEAYLRLVNQHNVDWRNRAQFCGLAANMMRRILVNHANARAAEKRDGGLRQSFEDATICVEEIDFDLLALDEALTCLAKQDEDKARLVEMKFFTGLTIDEIAFNLGKSTATVERDWRFARSWLYKAISRESI
jgi:RNA polymerase sigma factor (TIGR02999 family)